MPTVIRPMLPADMDRVLAIERQCHGYPWPAEIFNDELAAPHAHIDLLEEEGEIAGYLVWWLIAGEIEIQNVATALRHRRRGVGRQLMEHLLARAAELQVTRLLLEVRAGNAGAIALYRAFGFTDCGLRRHYYPDGEDALLMERVLE
jgi:ribosomal-protein-alanine N-acetyltransferase